MQGTKTEWENGEVQILGRIFQILRGNTIYSPKFQERKRKPLFAWVCIKYTSKKVEMYGKISFKILSLLHLNSSQQRLILTSNDTNANAKYNK